MAMEMYGGLPVFSLCDVLSQLPLPAPFSASAVSEKWRCVICPSAEVREGTSSSEELLISEEELMLYLESGIPVRASKARAAPAHAMCGSDSLEWVQDARWNAFSRPQIALRRGWGAPGTDMQVSSFYKMISSFSEVFHPTRGVEVPLSTEELEDVCPGNVERTVHDSAERSGALEEVLDLQLFHRSESSPPIPALGEHLQWPSFLDDAAVCDTATWVSQRGMVRHWHLNDGGEFVMQVALPLKAGNSHSDGISQHPALAPLSPDATAKRVQQLLCPEKAGAPTSIPGVTVQASPSIGNITSKPAMLIIFAPKGGYDWVLHDDQASASGKVVSLDLFSTPSEALPRDPAVLPILAVAVLESFGSPLIIPPNLAQTSIALRDCVVVEQRRVSNLWLDDVSYFFQRCERWLTPPMMYSYLQQELQDDHFVAGQVIPFLIRVFEAHAEMTAFHAAIRRRAVLSLYALAVNERHYGLSTGSRASLLSLLAGGNPAMHSVLQSSPYHFDAGHAEVPASLERWAILYWDVNWCWPKSGCVMRTPCYMYPLGETLTSPQQRVCFIPVVYPPTACSPVYGTEKESVEATVVQYFEMKDMETKPNELLAYLRSRKNHPDALLEDLF